MKYNIMLTSTKEKGDYLAVLNAMTGTKTKFTAEEFDKLLELYSKEAQNKFGFTDRKLLELLAAVDTAQDKKAPAGSPLMEYVGTADMAVLCELAALYSDYEQGPELALRAKDAAMAEGVSAPVALAAARAALDALAAKDDISPWLDEIKDLTRFLGQADEKTFADASSFLIRMRERMH